MIDLYAPDESGSKTLSNSGRFLLIHSFPLTSPYDRDHSAEICTGFPISSTISFYPSQAPQTTTPPTATRDDGGYVAAVAPTFSLVIASRKDGSLRVYRSRDSPKNDRVATHGYIGGILWLAGSYQNDKG